MDNENVYIINENGSYELETIEYFTKIWDVNAMIFDSDNVTPRKISFQERTLLLMDKLKKPFILTVILSLFVFFFIKGYELRNIYNYLFIALPSIGLLFSGMLVIEGFDEHNPLIRKFCTSKKSKNINCASILNSKDAYFIGVLSWSDVGLVYFSFILLLNLTIPSNISLIITGILSILAFPYVFYSITYQKFVAKSWCRLCLGVQGMLTTLFVVSLILFSSNDFITVRYAEGLIPAIFILLSICAAYITSKPLLEKSYEMKSIAAKYRSLKHDIEVKQLLFKNQPKISPASEYSIVIGNPEGETTITLVISPTCIPCMNELKILLPILKGKEDTRIELLFFTDKKEDDPIAYNLSKTLIDKYLNNANAFMDVLLNYVENYPSSKFRFNGYEFTFNDSAENILTEHIKYCVSNKLISTPQIFVNGRQLPSIYSVEELDYMCT